MPTEQEAIANLTEGEDRWLQLWSSHIGALDQKASIIVTLDGILLALTASFLGTALSHSFPVVASTLFGVSTVLVLFSAGACTRVAWVPFFSSRIIAEAGNMTCAYPHLLKSRSRKMRYLHLAILLLLGALTGYAATILLLLAQP
jgi:predicted membrane-bound mannosyltransferase